MSADISDFAKLSKIKVEDLFKKAMERLKMPYNLSDKDIDDAIIYGKPTYIPLTPRPIYMPTTIEPQLQHGDWVLQHAGREAYEQETAKMVAESRLAPPPVKECTSSVSEWESDWADKYSTD